MANLENTTTTTTTTTTKARCNFDNEQVPMIRTRSGGDFLTTGTRATGLELCTRTIPIIISAWKRSISLY